MTELTPAYAAAMPAPQGGALPTGLEWQALERMAHTLADSDVIPYRLKRKPADVAVILLAAREYGIPPLMALSKLPVVNGTPAPMGELMVALVLRAGHRITAKTHNPDGSVYKSGPIGRDHYASCTTLRRDEEAGAEDVLTFTVAEAEAAGLVSIEADGTLIARDNKGQPTPWELYPANMLRWRAVANACRLRFPDVLLGLSYLPEELGAVVDAEGAPVRVIDAEPVRTAPPASLAIRTAQETADRAADENRAEVLANVLEWAIAQEVADVEVNTAGGRLILRAYLERRIEEAKAVVDAVVVDAAQEAAPPVVGPDAPATPENPPSAVEEGLREPSGGDLVEAYVYDAVRTADPDVIRGMYRECKAAGLLDVPVKLDADVTAGLELAGITLEAPAPLGRLLMALGPRAASSGRPLVLDGPPADEPAVEDPDPPAWADTAQGHPDELPLP
jgi:hypothetical protein